MIRLFFEYPIFTGTVIVLSLVLILLIGRVNPQLEEILSTNIGFTFVEFSVMAFLGVVFVIGKALLSKNINK